MRASSYDLGKTESVLPTRFDRPLIVPDDHIDRLSPTLAQGLVEVPIKPSPDPPSHWTDLQRPRLFRRRFSLSYPL